MGLINAFIDCLDKKWGEQAMQRTLDEQDRRIAEKDRAIEALWKKKVELLRIRENRAKADAAWERAIAERTGGTVRTSPPIR